MTSLKKRLDNVLTELAIIRKGLDKVGRFPPCCLKVHNDGKISCDSLGPLLEKDFLRECRKCKTKIRKMLSHLNLEEIKNL